MVTAHPMSIQTLNSYLPKLRPPPPPLSGNRPPRNTRIKPFAQKPTPLAILSDPHVLRLAETLEDSVSSSSAAAAAAASPLQKLRDISSQSLLSTTWPSRKDESFRFTDTSFIKNSEIQPIPPSPTTTQSLDPSTLFADTLFPSLAIVDGYLVKSSSNLSELPNEVFVGALSTLKSDDVITERVSKYVSGFEGDMFWSLNGVGASDVIVAYVPEGIKVDTPLHLRFFSVNGSDKDSKILPISNPRVLVVVEKGAEISIVEEYISGDGDNDKCYWTNSVMEVFVGDGAKVSHSYIQTQSFGAAHVKWTSVRQDCNSAYEMSEVSTGGKLSRHNVHVQQLGPDTVTELSTFHLSIGDQLQDLHSKLVLDHPRGFSRQLHKCIVAHSLGQAVFDGNVQVNREAQQTDAGQLTRSLLLKPRATVNVKPNLQIIADDVKCSHGAAIYDLEENQLFYFQARGIDIETARRALIFSFASEVIQRFSNASVQKKVETLIRTLLDSTLSPREGK